MRCKKLKTGGGVAASLQHAFRDRPTPNADAALTPQNEHRLAASTDSAMGKLRELLPEKRRKDAVLCVEYMMSASPPWWETATVEQQKTFFDRSVKWLEDKFGAENVIVATVHRDETSPHLTAYVVPLVDGKLNAKAFIGSRGLLGRDQTSYAASVSDLGLTRGIAGSAAKHEPVKRLYGAVERPSEVTPKTIPAELLIPRVIEKGFLGFGRKLEPLEKTAKRLEGLVNKAYAPAFEATKAVAFQNDRIRALERQNNELKRALMEERKFLEGLTREEKMEWAPSLLEAVKPHVTEARENARKAEEQRVRELEQWVKEDERRFAENERLNQKLREQEAAKNQQKLKESKGIDNSPRPGRGSGPEL
jgi:hypothetical protein